MTRQQIAAGAWILSLLGFYTLVVIVGYELFVSYIGRPWQAMLLVVGTAVSGVLVVGLAYMLGGAYYRARYAWGRLQQGASWREVREELRRR